MWKKVLAGKDLQLSVRTSRFILRKVSTSHPELARECYREGHLRSDLFDEVSADGEDKERIVQPGSNEESPLVIDVPEHSKANFIKRCSVHKSECMALGKAQEQNM